MNLQKYIIKLQFITPFLPLMTHHFFTRKPITCLEHIRSDKFEKLIFICHYPPPFYSICQHLSRQKHHTRHVYFAVRSSRAFLKKVRAGVRGSHLHPHIFRFDRAKTGQDYCTGQRDKFYKCKTYSKFGKNACTSQKVGSYLEHTYKISQTN